MGINCNALSKLFADFCYLSLPALGVESLKTVLLLFHEVFYMRLGKVKVNILRLILKFSTYLNL